MISGLLFFFVELFLRIGDGDGCYNDLLLERDAIEDWLALDNCRVMRTPVID